MKGRFFFNFSISDSAMFGLCIRILLFNSCPKSFGVVLELVQNKFGTRERQGIRLENMLLNFGEVLSNTGVSYYRVFQLDMTYFEVQDGQLKLTSKFKKR